MQKRPKIAIIGNGNIGRALALNIGHEDSWDIRLFVNRNKYTVLNDDGEESLREGNPPASAFEGIDLAFLSIPTYDDGDTACRYIQDLLEQRILVVTCEKGALANHFKPLQPRLGNIGYSATVGGGSGMIGALQAHFSDRTAEVHVILNGTLNFLWGRLKKGDSLPAAVKEAQERGYTEPGQGDPIKIIRREIFQDATKKAAILFNLCMNPQPYRYEIRSHEFTGDLSDDAIRDAIDRAHSERFIVSFHPKRFFRKLPPPDAVFVKGTPNMFIVGQFMNADDPTIAPLCAAATGVNNGLLITKGRNNTCFLVGPGAGAEPTATAMIQDARRLLVGHN